MQKFYTDIRKYGNVIFHRGYDEHGEQFFVKNHFQPKMFIPTKRPSEWKFFYGDVPMEPVHFESMKEAWNEIENMKTIENFTLAGMEKFEYQYLCEQYPDEIDYDFDKLRILNVDIEVDSSDGFPEPALATEEITAITAEVKGQFFVWGTKEYTPKAKNVTYKKCENEYKLLNMFLAFWRDIKPDIVTGWNTDTFDVPYIYNRITNVLGEDRANMMSPWNVAKRRTIWVKNQELGVIDLVGIEQLDYLQLYRVFTYKKRESYKLDFIAHVELGERKLSYSDYQSLNHLYEEDYDKFIEYNIRDVELIQKLEDKLGLIKLATMLAYTTHVNFVDTMKQVRMWDSFIYWWLTREKIVVPIYQTGHKEYKYEGAYVKEPVVGKHGWLLSFDVNSLYPSLIRFLNISPEMLHSEIGQLKMKDLLNKLPLQHIANMSVAANGTKYHNKVPGLLPRMMKTIYSERTKHKKLSLTAKKMLENPNLDGHKKLELKREASLHGVLDKAMKTVLNSAYGALGSQYFRYYSTPMAEAITVSGQLTIRWVAKYINEYLDGLLEESKDRVIYSDTDSLYVSVEDLVQKYAPEANKDQVVTFLDQLAEQKLETIIQKAFDDLAAYLHAAEPEALAMKREIIADSGIWQAKKRYALNVIDSEGVRYAKPEMKIMGMETAKSSTPAIVRDNMKKLLYAILNADEQECQSMIARMRKEFRKLDVEDIAFPRGVSSLNKYYDLTNIYAKGSPIHVRASLLYNKLLRDHKLDKQYEFIKEGEKVKFVYLQEPNPIHENVIGFLQVLPREFNLEKFVDYDLMFDKAFLEPMKSIFDAIGWSTKKRKTLDSLFV